MKSAERRALDTGEVFSAQTKAQLKALPDEELKFKGKKCRAFNFLAPIILVAVLTVTTEDLLIGVFAALALCFVMYLPQRLMSVREYFNNIMAGLADMFSMLVIIILSYTLIEVNGQLGLVQFVVDIALKAVNPALLPATIFIVIGLLSFASGSFLGTCSNCFSNRRTFSCSAGCKPIVMRRSFDFCCRIWRTYLPLFRHGYFDLCIDAGDKCRVFQDFSAAGRGSFCPGRHRLCHHGFRIMTCP